MSIDNVLASVAVKDLKAAAAWYKALLGRPADSAAMPEVSEWRFARGGWLQVYQLPERAGSTSCTLAVSDLEEEIGRLRKLGIDTSNRSDSAAVRVLMIKDPDGNSIALAQALDASLAR